MLVMEVLRILSLACVLSATLVAQSGHVPIECGVWKEFEYENPDKTPIVFSGWSKATDAHAIEYCIQPVVYYADGTSSWSTKARFRCGTHDWEESANVIVPWKPVKRIKVKAVFGGDGKGHKTRGTVQFRDFRLERRNGEGETISSFSVVDRPFSNSKVVSKTIFEGRSVRTVSDTVQLTTTPVSLLPPRAVRVWTADSMQLVTPLSFPTRDAGRSISLSLAKRERESSQILISTGVEAECRAVSLRISQFRRRDGRAFCGYVDWRRQGYLAREHGARFHPYSFRADERWFPDPLLPPAPMRVRPASTQGTWLTVYAAPDAVPGEYFGSVAVCDGDKTIARVPMRIKVEDFSLPATFGVETAFSLADGFIRALYPKDYKARKREAIDIMLDHRLNPDDIGRMSPPEIEDLLHARKRGMNRFNILSIVEPPKDSNARWAHPCRLKTVSDPKFYETFVGTVRPYVQKLKEHGLDNMAYVYGFDEQGKEFYPWMESFWRKFQKDIPGIPMMTTARNYDDYSNRRIKGPLSCDWLCPTSDAYDMKVSETLRNQGKKVWWYVCCWPTYPYANFASWEYPPIEGRLLGWMTYLYRSDGLLFWIVNKWHGDERFDASDTFFPQFHTHNPNGMPGDGIMMYPGENEIWPSIKLAQCRDGVEDYEYLQLAAEKVGMNECDKITRTLVKTMTEYTRNPELLRSARERLTKIIVSK